MKGIISISDSELDILKILENVSEKRLSLFWLWYIRIWASMSYKSSHVSKDIPCLIIIFAEGSRLPYYLLFFLHRWLQHNGMFSHDVHLKPGLF